LILCPDLTIKLKIFAFGLDVPYRIKIGLSFQNFVIWSGKLSMGQNRLFSKKFPPSSFFDVNECVNSVLEKSTMPWKSARNVLILFLQYPP